MSGGEAPAEDRKTPPAQAAFSDGLTITPELAEAWRGSRARREIGRTLERIRRDAGLSRTGLAALMGEDAAFVADLESGCGDMPPTDHIALFVRHCALAT